MKKLISLIKACMTSDMNLFTIKQKKEKKNPILPIFLTFCFMFAIWSNANMIFEDLAPMHLQVIVISLIIFGTSLLTIAEGVYKSGPLLFNCKDDQLLLSLPIKRSTVLFVRVFKFYIFELIFNSLFIIPLIVAYLRWAETITWTFFLTSFVMLIFLPVIPVCLSCILGLISSNVSSKFKYKNSAYIIFSMALILGIMYISMNINKVAEYVSKHASSINDMIMKIYYPAGIYAKLIDNFNVTDILVFILVNIIIFVLTILILSKFYFKINSKLKSVSTSKSIKVDDLVIKSKSPTKSLIKKELNTFFKTPVFIINAGFGLVLFIIASIALSIKFNQVIPLLKDYIPENIIYNYVPILIFILISFASYMTSITNSVISLEGKNINILKSLPINTKTILMSKIYAALTITTIPILIGDIILFIRFRINIIEMILLLILSILIPLISHFIGLIINLKYPKLDWENTAEVVKQSLSSFVSVTLGIVLLIITVGITVHFIGKIKPTYLLLITFVFYIILNYILYTLLNTLGVKEFNRLSI